MYLKKIIPFGIAIVINVTSYSQSLIKLGKIEVASKDLSAPGYSIATRFKEDELTYYLEEHPEWRLPTLDELMLMYEKRNELGMQGDWYIACGMNKGGYTIPVKYSNSDWYKNPFGKTFYVGFYNSGRIETMLSSDIYVRLVKK
jgi:hypothetical protein